MSAEQPLNKLIAAARDMQAARDAATQAAKDTAAQVHQGKPQGEH